MSGDVVNIHHFVFGMFMTELDVCGRKISNIKRLVTHGVEFVNILYTQSSFFFDFSFESFFFFFPNMNMSPRKIPLVGKLRAVFRSFNE